MSEQLTRRQLREARKAGVATPETTQTPLETTTPLAAEAPSQPPGEQPREFTLTDSFPVVDVTPTSESNPERLNPDDLLRKFRDRIRTDYQDGSIPVPQAKLPESVAKVETSNSEFDLEAFRQRLRAAADVARAQVVQESGETQFDTPVVHEPEQLSEVTEFDIASRKSTSTLQVGALRESFAEGQVPDSLGAVPEMPETVQIHVVPEIESHANEAELDRSNHDDGEVSFSGTNLMAEPSTRSIVLDVIPDAVTMPINLASDTIITGSINVVPEQTVSDVTGAIAGVQTDESTLKDTVTGAISVIEPVSALEVIAQRQHHSVLPMSTLRRGWWQPYAVAIGIFAMIGAAAYAVYLVLEVLNS